jgi:hypothetical protein
VHRRVSSPAVDSTTGVTSFLQWIPSNKEEEESIKETSRLLTTVSVSSCSRYCQKSDSARYPVRNGVTFLCRHEHCEIELVDKENPWKTWSQWFSFQSNFWVKLKVEFLGTCLKLFLMPCQGICLSLVRGGNLIILFSWSFGQCYKLCKKIERKE